MEVKKETRILSTGTPSQIQLEAINAQAKAVLTPEQVYVFSLRLCDDQIDRDFERFDTQALPELAKLFIGKTGIVDHRWSADAQVARIFSAEVVREEGVSYIKAWAYIRRGGQADETIADVEAGIKKEVSVACSMGRSICSVCGSEYGTCSHHKGSHYDGQLCCAILKEPMDAYEFSFVAVPAQPNAGVLKGYGRGLVSLKELAEEYGVQGEYRELKKQALLGQQYRRELEAEVVRLCLSLELGMEAESLKSIAQGAADEDLKALKGALESRLARHMPIHAQLSLPGQWEDGLDSGYLI